MNGKLKIKATSAETCAFWESWERLFGPPALRRRIRRRAARGRLVVRSPGQAPLRLPDVGQRVELGGHRGLVLEVFRTAAAAEADAGGPPYGWRLRLLLEGGTLLTCKPQVVRCL